ncbi:MAG: OB-fold domain-containing protein [Mycobacterium sp.]
MKPLRDDVISIDPPGLKGIACQRCRRRSFPSRQVCPFCGNQEVDDVVLSGRGTVASWTVVHQAPPPLATPYRLVTVDLEDGVRLLGVAEGAPTIGSPVEVELHALRTDEQGTELSWYRFREVETV